MKKKLFASAVLFVLIAGACVLPACKKQINYSDYVSERRTDIYLYKDDTVEIKIYCGQKEQPYAADGYKGEVSDLTEIFVTLPKNPSKLEVSVGGHGGEMNYQAVDNRYCLSFSAQAFTTNGVDVTLISDGESKTYSALTVIYDGVLSCDEAVNCAVEHDRELFESLTVNGIFNGEIYVRLIFDEKCYYYVGVCDKQKKITAYLIDGERGKVIATKQLQS